VVPEGKRECSTNQPPTNRQPAHPGIFKRSRLSLTADFIRSSYSRSGSRRQRLLETLLGRLRVNDLRLAYAEAERQSQLVKGNSLIEQLPNSLTDKIFEFLPHDDVERCGWLSETFSALLDFGIGLRHCWPPRGLFTAGAVNKLRDRRFPPELLTCTEIAFDPSRSVEVCNYVAKLTRVRRIQLLGPLAAEHHELFAPLFSRVEKVTFSACDDHFTLPGPVTLDKLIYPNDLRSVDLHQLPNISFSSMPKLLELSCASEFWNWDYRTSGQLSIISYDFGESLDLSSLVPYLRDREVCYLDAICDGTGSISTQLSSLTKFAGLEAVVLTGVALEFSMLRGLIRLKCLRLQESILLVDCPRGNLSFAQWVDAGEDALLVNMTQTAIGWPCLSILELFDVRYHFKLATLGLVYYFLCISLIPLVSLGLTCMTAFRPLAASRSPRGSMPSEAVR